MPELSLGLGCCFFRLDTVKITPYLPFFLENHASIQVSTNPDPVLSKFL